MTSSCRLRARRLLQAAILLMSPLILVEGSRAFSADDKGGEAVNSAEYKVIMSMLGTQIRANFESIQTWEGTFDFGRTAYFSDDVQIPANAAKDSPQTQRKLGPYWEITKGHGEFHLDIVADKSHRYTKVIGVPRTIAVSTGEEVERNLLASESHWIVTPEHWLEFGVNENYGQLTGFEPIPGLADHAGRVVFRREREKSEGYAVVFKLKEMFGNGSHLFWQTCESWANVLQGDHSEENRKKALENLSIAKRTEDGHIVYVVSTTYPGAGVILATTYDSSVGFNVVRRVQSIKGRTVDERTIRYQTINGIEIPKYFEHTKHRTDAAKAGVIDYSSEITLTDSKLNQSIDPQQFTIDELGLRYGDRMHDEIENKLYVHDSSGFVAAEKFVLDPQKFAHADGRHPNPDFLKANENKFPTVTIVIVNLVIIAAVLLGLYLRRKKT